MYCTRNITEELIWVGGNDRRLSLFEGIYSVPDGVAYNSYLLLDKKTVLFDTVDQAVGRQFFENLASALKGRALDYLVVHHMEPDHSAVMEELIEKYPGVRIVCNQKSVQMIRQYFTFDVDSRAVVVKEGDVLESGAVIGYVSEPTKYYSTEGSNVYFAMTKDGEPVDPVLYLE